MTTIIRTIRRRRRPVLLPRVQLSSGFRIVPSPPYDWEQEGRS